MPCSGAQRTRQQTTARVLVDDSLNAAQSVAIRVHGHRDSPAPSGKLPSSCSSRAPIKTWPLPSLCVSIRCEGSGKNRINALMPSGSW